MVTFISFIQHKPRWEDRIEMKLQDPLHGIGIHIVNREVMKKRIL